VSDANGAVAVAHVLHGANLEGQLDSRQDQVSAGKAKKRRRHNKTRKKRCEQQPLAIGSEGLAAQQPGADSGLTVILTMVERS
jgi:hypothetical protein